VLLKYRKENQYNTVFLVISRLHLMSVFVLLGVAGSAGPP